MDEDKLSRNICFILRHRPDQFNITLDSKGFVAISTLVLEMNNKNTVQITYDDVIQVANNCNKQRFEIIGDKIRANYGHSIEKKIEKQNKHVECLLYHGTSQQTIDNILKVGLNPQQRQYVHLSGDIETAVSVGGRRDSNPIILEIDTKMAQENGVNFYKENHDIYLSDSIPATFLRVIDYKKP